VVLVVTRTRNRGFMTSEWPALSHFPLLQVDDLLRAGVRLQRTSTLGYYPGDTFEPFHTSKPYDAVSWG
jgi:hypothetical protein